MKGLFGVVSLLIVLAIVGLVAVRQLKSVGHVGSSSPATGAATATGDVPAVPQMSGSGTLHEQARQLGNQVADDAVKALTQGAAARQQESDKQ